MKKTKLPKGQHEEEVENVTRYASKRHGHY